MADWIESLRQHAVIGSILGVRTAIATITSLVNPTGTQTVQKDQMAAATLLAQGNYERAFEIATGFAEYFDIKEQAKKSGSGTGETAAVMMGHATGFNQAVETVKGEDSSGNKLSSIERIGTGLEALSRIAATALTVAGGVHDAGFGGSAKVVSPVYRIAGRDIVIVESSVGRQAFYRSTGINSKTPGRWLPVDEFRPSDGWFNKAAYTQGPGLEKGAPLHRVGTKEYPSNSAKYQFPTASKCPLASMKLQR
jgi:hypothetical protein